MISTEHELPLADKADAVAERVRRALQERFPKPEALLREAGSLLHIYLSPGLYAEISRVVSTYAALSDDPAKQRELRRKGGEIFRDVLQALYMRTDENGDAVREVAFYYYGCYLRKDEGWTPLYTFGPPLCKAVIVPMPRRIH